MLNRQFLRILSFAAIILVLKIPASARQHSKRPNILFIMADDHTSQAWGIYGGILQPYVQNNHIQRLAATGAVLNNVFCTNSICVPSRATVLTGQHSNNNGVYTLSDALDPAHPNIAKELQRAGYRTAIFGKWHLKKMPAGFDTFNVLPGQGIYHNPRFLSRQNWNDQEQGGEVKEGFVDDLTTDMSIGWLKQQSSEQPFFLMCHFKSTHEPFDFADRFKDLNKDVEFPYPSSFADSGASTTGRSFRGQPLEELGRRYTQASQGDFWTSYPELPFTTSGLDGMDARKKIYQKFIRDYLRCAAGINDNIGKLLDYLEAAGLRENTVVIYTSDQGYFLGEHGFMDKRMMYEESLRMPFVISYPAEIPKGSRLNEMVLNTDFAALFADYARIEKPAFVQGESFREILRGQGSAGWRKSMYYRYWQHYPIRPAHFGIRNNRYKLIYFYGRRLGMSGSSDEETPAAWEFYDLEKDPFETHNAVADRKYKRVIRKMKKELKRLQTEAGDQAVP